MEEAAEKNDLLFSYDIVSRNKENILQNILEDDNNHLKWISVFQI